MGEAAGQRQAGCGAVRVCLCDVSVKLLPYAYPLKYTHEHIRAQRMMRGIFGRRPAP